MIAAPTLRNDPRVEAARAAADPALRQLEVYRLDHGALREVARYTGGSIVVAHPFESVRFDLSELWGW